MVKRESTIRRWERRKEMVKKHGTGYKVSEYEKGMAKDYGVSVNTIRSDWTRRHEWLPVLAQLEDGKLVIAEVIMQIRLIREAAWTTYRDIRNAERRNYFAEVSALGKLREITKTEVEFLHSMGVMERAPLAIQQLITFDQEKEQAQEIMDAMTEEELRDLEDSLKKFEGLVDLGDIPT